MAKKQIIVLINFNYYLGGGETLLVRFSSYLKNKGADFFAFCLEGSYIQNDLKKREICEKHIVSLSINPDYYYQNEVDRKQLIAKLLESLNPDIDYKIVTFCMRDLYTAFALSKKINCSITHLILHPEDDKYVGQTIVDKLRYKISKKREFNQTSMISFNQTLMNIVNDHNGLISMTEVISKVWKSTFGIDIPRDNTVPLPSFKEREHISKKQESWKKIIWIGRIVDFKIPSLLKMIDFVKENPAYSMTIVGDGNREEIESYLQKNTIFKYNIFFKGQVNYDELASIINQHSIGYAMGTSLIELAQYKMPVIVALASLDHLPFKRPICGGLFFNKYRGCDGTDLLIQKEDEIKWTISDTIKEIEASYDESAIRCYQFAKENFSEEKNFDDYLTIINNAKPLRESEKNLRIPFASTARKILYKYFGNA